MLRFNNTCNTRACVIIQPLWVCVKNFNIGEKNRKRTSLNLKSNKYTYLQTSAKQSKVNYFAIKYNFLFVLSKHLFTFGAK